MARPVGPIGFALVTVLLAIRTALAACGDSPGDTAVLAAARAAIATGCPCATSSHRTYTRCAGDVLKDMNAAGHLSGSCAKAAKRCASRSTCGKPGAVTCCQHGGSQTKCKITTPERCMANGGCVGTYESCCDACATSGCASTTTTTTTVPGVCGNGIIEGGEWCDGDEFCESNCAIRRFACCEFATPSGGTCSATVPAFTLFVYQASVCGNYGGTFQLGRVAAAGETCTEPLAGYSYPEQTGACVPAPELSQPATICCQQTESSCLDSTTTSQEAITGFVWGCLYSHYPNSPVVAGTCRADGRCAPAH